MSMAGCLHDARAASAKNSAEAIASTSVASSTRVSGAVVPFAIRWSAAAPTATVPMAIAKTLMHSIVKPETVERIFCGVMPASAALAGP